MADVNKDHVSEPNGNHVSDLNGTPGLETNGSNSLLLKEDGENPITLTDVSSSSPTVDALLFLPARLVFKYEMAYISLCLISGDH